MFSGQKFRFEWDTNHNVVEVKKAVYSKCTETNLEKNKVDTKPVNGPSKNFSHDKAGTYYYVCGVEHHCDKHNQKAKITIKKNCDKKRRKKRRRRRRRTHRH